MTRKWACRSDGALEGGVKSTAGGGVQITTFGFPLDCRPTCVVSAIVSG
jgi:hypothetical protein